MVNENCTDCLYSCYSMTLEMMDLIGRDIVECNHENSPYYKRIVNQDNTCRLFIDANEKFKMEDRRESILKIKENIRLKR